MHADFPSSFSRRKFLAAGAATGLLSTLSAAETIDSRQAGGVKVGEVTDHSAILWTRLTVSATRNTVGTRITGKPKKEKQPPLKETATLEGACPGAEGRIRVRYSQHADLREAKVTDWHAVSAKTDFSHGFQLTGLPSNTRIHYAVETADPGETGKPHAPLKGTFRTAPRANVDVEIPFAVVTCQMYADLDHAEGFHIYPAIAKLAPHFVVFTGDNVYYDSEEPIARSAALARYHWQRMYSLPRHVELLRKLTSYWEKDDHDTVKNDCWAGQRLGNLTFAEGQQIFREQVPMSKSIYRTFRWGKHLQIWLTDGRDFRSPNRIKDGPDKTIWGKEQKAWLFRTMKESNARWKILISPTPLVGPDRANKGDNHANANFRHEGDEVRAWFKDNVADQVFVLCGDRHWQYHSVHPKTGLHEFSVGAASDKHAGGSPGLNKTYHRFHRVKGGFLTVTAGENAIAFRHHDVHGKVVNEYTAK